MPIVKATLSLTVLLPQDEADKLQTCSLSDLQYEITEGAWIASGLVRSAPTVVPRDELQGALREIGNDGSFFSDEDAADLATSVEE
jgi:hypothetical protein